MHKHTLFICGKETVGVQSFCIMREVKSLPFLLSFSGFVVSLSFSPCLPLPLFNVIFFSSFTDMQMSLPGFPLNAHFGSKVERLPPNIWSPLPRYNNKKGAKSTAHHPTSSESSKISSHPPEFPTPSVVDLTPPPPPPRALMEESMGGTSGSRDDDPNLPKTAAAAAAAPRNLQTKKKKKEK